MSDEQPKSKRKRRGCFAKLLQLLLVLLVLFLVWLAFNLRPVVSPGQPLVTVATELTKLTEPLNEDGDVDYLEALNLEYSEGVTTESNAMVKFAQALGPSDLPIEFVKPFCERLGIPVLAAPSESTQYFAELDHWFHNQSEKEQTQALGIDEDDFAMPLSEPNEPAMFTRAAAREVLLEFNYGREFPWTVEQFPVLAKWIEHNAGAIETVEEGLVRPDYYCPLVAVDVPEMMNINLDVLQNLRGLTSYFAARSMLRLGQGKVEEAIDDVEAIFRLSSFVERSPTIVEKLISMALLKTAIKCSMQITISEKTNVAHLERVQAISAKVGVAGDLVNRMDEAERYATLDALCTVGRGQMSESFGRIGGDSLQKWAICHLVDFEEVFLMINNQYDSNIKNFRESAAGNPVQREESKRSFNQKMVMLQHGTTKPWKVVRAALGGRTAKGDLVGRIASCLTLPGAWQLIESEKRLKSSLEMSKIVVAIHQFKKANRRFPETLDELVPQYLDAVSEDPFSLLPFQYKQVDDRITLHSDAWISPDNPEYDDLYSAALNRNSQLLMAPKKITFQEFLEDDSR